MIEVPGILLADTFTIFRGCGRARRECVAYWLGPASSPCIADEVAHPVHRSVRGGYQIDSNWLTAFWFDLARRHKSVRVQVHTHPHAAFHSTTDDEWALVHTPGFLSLVIPGFGLGPVSLERAFLAERATHGWQQVSVQSRLEVVI